MSLFFKLLPFIVAAALASYLTPKEKDMFANDTKNLLKIEEARGRILQKLLDECRAGR